jgi:DNA-binding response OmpR family regulator
MKVIVAEADATNQGVLPAPLREWGHDVRVVHDGQRAWELIATEPGPRIVLLDWVLPGLEGPELCRRLRTLPNQQLIYAVLLTRKIAQEEVIAGLRAGADDYMTRPLDQAELFARLQVGIRVLSLQAHLTRRIDELADALTRVKQLQGLLPICCYCKNIRTDDNYWQHVEQYLAQHTDLQFSHGICPRCYQNVVEPQLQQLKTAKAAEAVG